jgi:parvulin-like peptidyl-prolyl isomerase
MSLAGVTFTKSYQSRLGFFSLLLYVVSQQASEISQADHENAQSDLTALSNNHILVKPEDIQREEVDALSFALTAKVHQDCASEETYGILSVPNRKTQ